jgi:hypothetical protein
MYVWQLDAGYSMAGPRRPGDFLAACATARGFGLRRPAAVMSASAYVPVEWGLEGAPGTPKDPWYSDYDELE